jgi:hypothetical protein
MCTTYFHLRPIACKLLYLRIKYAAIAAGDPSPVSTIGEGGKIPPRHNTIAATIL